MLGNIERTSGLYLTKTVYAMLLALAVGVAGLAFPFLPRHLTLIGSVTIGIPSFFLALGPNTERARPGFLRRVARFAIPAGTLAAVATFLAYQVAGEEPGITLGQQRTSATMLLTWIGLLVLSIIAAPLTRARLGLVWSMAGLFLAVMLTPPARDFFALHPPDDLMWLASFGVAAIVVVRQAVRSRRPTVTESRNSPSRASKSLSSIAASPMAWSIVVSPAEVDDGLVRRHASRQPKKLGGYVSDHE